MTRFRRTVLPWAVTGVLLLGTLLPKSWMPFPERPPEYATIPHLDKAVHFLIFSGFALCWAIAGRSVVPSRARVGLVLTAALVLTVGTELAQGIPRLDRDPDSLDALADAAGSLAGVGVVAACGATAAPGGTS